MCLEHLSKLQLVNDRYRIEHSTIVVDSHSGDQTPSRIQQEFPNVQVIASQTNLGYTGGNNLGFKKAMEQGAEYIAVVTQDVYVKPDWLLHALDTAEKDPDIGVVQPLLLLYPEREKINSTGNAIHFLGYGYAGDYQMPLRNYNERFTKEIPYFSGAIVLFRSKALQATGYFDADLWMYNEDQDLGWRMWLLGYKNVMAPFSRAYHQYEFSRSISKLYYMDRNRLIVILQNYKLATILLILPALVLNELAGLLLAWKGGWLKEKLKVWSYFLNPRHWLMIAKKRRSRQAHRTVDDKDIIHRFTGAILFQDVMNPVVKYIANPVLSLYFIVLKFIVRW